MGKFFKADNWFFTGVTKLLHLVIVNAMFLICSIPVITFGASYSGLYYAINKNLKFDRGYAVQTFFDGFKNNFKKSTKANVLFLAIILVFLGDIAVIKTFAELGKGNINIEVFFYVLMALVWIYATWVFAYIAVFENTLKLILKNCVIIFFAELGTTVYSAFILAFAGVVIYVIPPLVFLMPGVAVWLISHRMQRSFRKYMTQEQRNREDELNHISDLHP